MSKSWEEILGGYATGTLTEEEKRQLFEAALHDQALFDTLADEEALKALLADPQARQRILESLQSSNMTRESTAPSSQRLSWFRKSSSLAWAGSLAAMGLALIFGWQMNKEWGSIVQQEQETARSVSEGTDNGPPEFRSQSSPTGEMSEPAFKQPQKDQKESERSAGLATPIPSTPPTIIAKAAKDSERIRLPSRQVPSEDFSQQAVKKERQLKATHSMSPPPESAMVQDILEEEPVGAPSVASVEDEEKGSQQLARAPSFADRLQEEDAPSLPSARELFFGNQRTHFDEIEEEGDGRRERQALRGLSSQSEKALPADASDVKKTKEADQQYSQAEVRGIRYTVVQQKTDGKDEAIDTKTFSGKWSELQLVIESNVSGQLYVLTSFGKGKWQWLRPELSNVPKSSDGAIQVNPYQPVNFALSHVTNTLGKPVVSSIRVILTSSPLLDLGQWLGKSIDIKGIMIVQEGNATFAMEKVYLNEEPMMFTISFEDLR